MYRIMIVDDEPLILAGIASLLNWEEYQCRIVGKASNGAAGAVPSGYAPAGYRDYSHKMPARTELPS